VIPTYLRDNTRSRILRPDGNYYGVHRSREAPHRAKRILDAARFGAEPLASETARKNGDGFHTLSHACPTPAANSREIWPLAVTQFDRWRSPRPPGSCPALEVVDHARVGKDSHAFDIIVELRLASVRTTGETSPSGR